MLFLAIISLCTQSCQESNKFILNSKATLINEFPIVDTIHFSNLVEYKIGVPIGIFPYDSTLVIFNDSKRSRFFFNNYSLNSGEFSKGYVPKGRGPNEYISGSSAGIFSNKLWFYDINKKKIVMSDINNVITNKTFLPCIEYTSPAYHGNISIVDSLHFCGIGKMTPSSISKIEMINLISNETINTYGEYQKNSDDLNLETITGIYNASIFTKPSGGKVVMSYVYSDLIEVYDLNTGKHIGVHGPEKYDVYFQEKKNSSCYYMGKSINTRKAFKGGAVTDENIFLVYSGHKTKNRSRNDRYKSQHGRSIYVYDWEGKPVKKLVFDKYIYDLAVSENGKTLYSYDDSTGYIIKADIK